MYKLESTSTRVFLKIYSCFRIDTAKEKKENSIFTYARHAYRAFLQGSINLMQKLASVGRKEGAAIGNENITQGE